MTRAGWVAAIAVGLVPGLLPAAGDAATCRGAETCPQVFHVYGRGSGAATLDLLVLPDGFTAVELPLYRCAVALLFDALLRKPPFDRVAHAINVYRIDQSASSSGIGYPGRCRGESPGPFSDPDDRVRDACASLERRPHTELAQGILGRPVLSPGSFCESCTRCDLDFRHDPAITSDCRAVWTDADGLRRIWGFTRCAPKTDIVVVVVNSTAHAGAGNGESQPPVSVVALHEIEDEDRRVELLAHELGHALGLLDEYVGRAVDSTASTVPFFAGRNVARRVDGSLDDPPWAGECDPRERGCVVFLADDRGLKPRVGLLEGAFYQTTDHFRATDRCLLRHEHEYCAGCRVYLERLFRELGLLPQEPSGERSVP